MSLRDFDEALVDAQKKYSEMSINHAVDCVEKAVQVMMDDGLDKDECAMKILRFVQKMVSDGHGDAVAACLLNLNANLFHFTPSMQALICFESGSCYLAAQSYEHALNKFEQTRKLSENGALLPQEVEAIFAYRRGITLSHLGRTELAFTQLTAAYRFFDKLADDAHKESIARELTKLLPKIDSSKQVEFEKMATGIQLSHK